MSNRPRILGICFQEFTSQFHPTVRVEGLLPVGGGPVPGGEAGGATGIREESTSIVLRDLRLDLILGVADGGPAG